MAKPGEELAQHEDQIGKYLSLPDRERDLPKENVGIVDIINNQLTTVEDKNIFLDDDVSPDGRSKNNNVIINTYMRSGSTFLGNVFSIRNDVFYIFEPLWQIQKFAYFQGENQLCHYYKDVCKAENWAELQSNNGRETKVSEARTYLNSLLNCDFYQPTVFLPDPVRFPKEFPNLNHGWNFCKGPAWESYRQCAERADAKFQDCLMTMKPVCGQAKHRVLKVLRSTLDNFEPMLDKMPNLKVLQLFRDPRGILNSHLTTNFYWKKVQTVEEITDDMKVHCRRILYDISVAKRFLTRFPDQFRVVQYEDFFDLERKAKALYDFAEMELTDEIRQDLNKKLIMPQGARAGFHPYSYTTKLPWKYERLIFKYCKQVYIELGYPIFNSEHQYMKFSEKETFEPLPYSL